MRLFTGLSIGPTVLAALTRLLEELKPAAALRWSPVENLHITTKFVGSWPDEGLGDLISRLDAMPETRRFPVTVSHLGFLPNPHRPRTLLAGVQSGVELAALAKSIEEALVTIGCSREERRFTPHVTLARIKDEDVRGLRERIASMSNLNFGSFEVTHFHLYVSRPGPLGSAYRILKSFPLAAGAA